MNALVSSVVEYVWTHSPTSQTSLFHSSPSLRMEKWGRFQSSVASIPKFSHQTETSFLTGLRSKMWHGHISDLVVLAQFLKAEAQAYLGLSRFRAIFEKCQSPDWDVG